MQHSQSEPAPLIIDSLLEEMRLFLHRREMMWDKIFDARPDISPTTVQGFVRSWSASANPTVKTLRLIEAACRILDPNFLSPFQRAATESQDSEE